MSDKIPEPGTEEFATFISSHFQTLTDTLRDIVGADAFAQHVAIMMGVTSNVEGQFGIRVRAVGGLRSSVTVCAQICNLAARNYMKNAGISYQEAMMRVLHDLQTDMTSLDLHFEENKK